MFVSLDFPLHCFPILSTISLQEFLSPCIDSMIIFAYIETMIVILSLINSVKHRQHKEAAHNIKTIHIGLTYHLAVSSDRKPALPFSLFLKDELSCL